MNKKRVLIFQNKIMHYRLPIFNILGNYYDLTLLYSSGPEPSPGNYKVEKLATFSLPFLGRFTKKPLLCRLNKYDIVISQYSSGLRNINLFQKLHKTKSVVWGIGVAASYGVRFDQDEFFFKKLVSLARKSDGFIFYSSYPIKKYIECGINKDKLFVANNTVAVLPIEKKEKDSILFIGSLYKEKRIDLLLSAYERANIIDPCIPKLVIIGDGDEKENISNWIKEKSLESKVILTGAIFDELLLSQYFANAILCISPDQAGLSVLKSMGYGVPFVTSRNAITGGEIFNIHNGEDGILLESIDEIENILLDIRIHMDKYLLMGEKAKEYYDHNRTPEMMAQGFVSCISSLTL